MAPVLSQDVGNRIVFVISDFDHFVAQMCKYAAELLQFHKQNMHLNAEALLAGDAARFPVTSHGELAALTWCVHGHFAWHARQEAPDRFDIVDFDQLMQSPRIVLSNLAERVGIDDFTSEDAEALLVSNAKDTSRRHSARDRSQELSSMQILHSEEIARGRRWLERFCQDQPFSLASDFAA